MDMAKIPAAIRQALALCLEVYAPAQRRKEGWTSNFWDCQEVEIAARSISKFAPGTASQGEFIIKVNATVSPSVADDELREQRAPFSCADYNLFQSKQKSYEILTNTP
ncbi:hypothetical protein TNCT_347911 [Trichonephila clavata]|uniref:Uncharacterized protein n=1 Tax=Trichonephila clavata TaxID=2740835 RepID=A0A8X6I0W7_TRICU|nr:hypothetical protein TNCT_347911 [Trichonephila clavata]